MNINALTPEQLEKAANMLKAIAHPTRLAILNLLEERKKLNVKELHQLLNIEQSTTSHHLGILKDKDVLGSSRNGKNTFYFIKQEKLSIVVDCISKCACE